MPEAEKLAEQPEPPGGKSLLERCSSIPYPFENPAIGQHSCRLGLCVADRVAMGVCLPRGVRPQCTRGGVV